MIPKGEGIDYRGVGLVEVLCKAISGIINLRILSFIQFHDALNGFCAERVTGTATLEAKLLQHIIAMRDTVLHDIFLGLRKSYGNLIRDLCLDILEGHGVGPSTHHILRTYWVPIHIAEQARGQYRTVFQIHRRVTQGDPLSTTIFNVVVDAVI